MRWEACMHGGACACKNGVLRSPIIPSSALSVASLMASSSWLSVEAALEKHACVPSSPCRKNQEIRQGVQIVRRRESRLLKHAHKLGIHVLGPPSSACKQRPLRQCPCCQCPPECAGSGRRGSHLGMGSPSRGYEGSTGGSSLIYR